MYDDLRVQKSLSKDHMVYPDDMLSFGYKILKYNVRKHVVL